jgi:alkylhydroperoxidase family enzyme
MARVPYLDPDDLPPDQRDLLARPANLFRALVHSPDGLRHVARVGGWIRTESRLDPRLRELAILQVGFLTGAAYEWTHHIDIGRRFGVTDDDVRAVAADTAGRPSDLGGVELAVLRVAREVTTDLRASDDAFTAVEAALGHEELVELVLVVAFYNMVVRLLATLEIDLEPEYVELLERFPLPQPPTTPREDP